MALRHPARRTARCGRSVAAVRADAGVARGAAGAGHRQLQLSRARVGRALVPARQRGQARGGRRRRGGAASASCAARGVPTPEPLHARRSRAGARSAKSRSTLFPWVHGARGRPDAAIRRRCALAGRGARAAPRAALASAERAAAQPLHARRAGAAAADVRRRSRASPRWCRRSRASSRARAAAARPRAGSSIRISFPTTCWSTTRASWRRSSTSSRRPTAPLVYDLAVALNAWCWDGDAHRQAGRRRAALGVRGGASARTPSAPPGDEARLAAARFTITRITDVFLPEGVDEDLRQRKDFTEYVHRLE